MGGRLLFCHREYFKDYASPFFMTHLEPERLADRMSGNLERCVSFAP